MKFRSTVPVGQAGMFKGVNPAASMVSTTVVVLFIVLTIANAETAAEIFNTIQNWIQRNLDWYYILSVCIFLFALVYLAFSRFGHIRLGQDDEEPEFGYFAWFSMLFSAGMGIGVLFWSIAEPLYYFQGNPHLEAGMEETMTAAYMAVQVVFLHWGLHGWAIYALVGLGLAYFAYRQGLPLTIRSVLYPVFGEKMNGPLGLMIDTFAIFSTLFGICTTLGAGAGLVNAGLDYLFGLEQNISNQVVIIIVVATIAMGSVMSGLRRGIKVLSELNVWLSVVLLLVFIFAGPTVFLLGFTLTSMGDYLVNFIPMGFWVDPDPQGEWQGAWTVFYWGWWISWAPFVGMFIARISRGRTIREFCLGALFAPTIICIIWFGVFGGTALHMAMFSGNEILAVLDESISKPIFYVIENMGLGGFTRVIAMLALTLIISYFVTSSDSGTLVITTIISMGDPEPNRAHRIFWALAQALAAVALLLAGGLDALKTAALAAGLPFSFIIYLMIYGLLKSCIEETSLAPAQQAGES